MLKWDRLDEKYYPLYADITGKGYKMKRFENVSTELEGLSTDGLSEVSKLAVQLIEAQRKLTRSRRAY